MRETYSIQLAIVTGCLVVAVTVLFALLQSPEILSVPSKAGDAIPHPIAAHQQCDSCHGFRRSQTLSDPASRVEHQELHQMPPAPGPYSGRAVDQDGISSLPSGQGPSGLPRVPWGGEWDHAGPC